MIEQMLRCCELIRMLPLTVASQLMLLLFFIVAVAVIVAVAAVNIDDVNVV